MKKIKLLVVGITMNCAGTEKSFLSFLSVLDREKYDVTLLLAKAEGLLMDQIPSWVNVRFMEKYGDTHKRLALANFGMRRLHI